jgi:hypothetical protein
MYKKNMITITLIELYRIKNPKKIKKYFDILSSKKVNDFIDRSIYMINII